MASGCPAPAGCGPVSRSSPRWRTGPASARSAPGRIVPVIPEIEWNGKPYKPRVNKSLGGAPANAVEQEIHEVRIELARRYASANGLNKITVNPATPGWASSPRAGCYHEVLEAAHSLGLDEDGLRRNGIRLLQLGMVYPLDGEICRRFAMGLQEIMVVEEKRGFIELHLRDALYGMPDAPRVVGKKDPDGTRLVPTHGALDSDSIVEPLRRRFLQKISAERLTPAPAPAAASPVAFGKKVDLLPARTPVLLLGLPALDGHQGPRGRPGRRRHRLSRPGRADGPQAGRHDHGQHADGRRGCPLDRHRALRRRRPLHPEPGRRHVRPLGLARHPCRGGGQVPHHLQDPLQRRRRHDRRPGRGGRHADPQAGGLAAERGRESGHHHHRRAGQVQGRVAALGRGRVGPRPHPRRPGGTAQGLRCHGVGPRPAVRGRKAPGPQAGPARRAARADRHQRAGLRRLRRLRRAVQLSVGSADRHRVRPQDPDPPVQLQQGLFVPCR